jgi:hypothetical membrane protein
MSKIARPAAIAAVIGPIQNVAGWLIAGIIASTIHTEIWPGYDGVRQTISELASPQSPVLLIMSAFFLLGGVLSLITGVYAGALAWPGRIAIFVGGLCMFGITVFPTPLIGYSVEHRVFAIVSFVLFSAWPLLSMRFGKDKHVLLRPLVSIIATVIYTVISFWFLFTWTDPTSPYTGVLERLLSFIQTAWLSFVVLTVWRSQRKLS